HVWIFSIAACLRAGVALSRLAARSRFQPLAIFASNVVARLSDSAWEFDRQPAGWSADAVEGGRSVPELDAVVAAMVALRWGYRRWNWRAQRLGAKGAIRRFRRTPPRPPTPARPLRVRSAS